MTLFSKKAVTDDLPVNAGRPAKAWSRTDLLAAGLNEQFVSRRVAVAGTTLHAVIGGNGPALVLLPGWPQTWYAWRHTMNTLANDYTVIVVDPRGFGGSDAQPGDYALSAIADEIVFLIQEHFGLDRFYLAGHDVGAWIAYTMAVRHSAAIDALVLCEAMIPGLTEGPPLFMKAGPIDWAWHFAFNRVKRLNEVLVQDREYEFLKYQFDVKTYVSDAICPRDIDLYARSYRSRSHLRASFDYYRAFDTNVEHAEAHRDFKLPMPVLALGGEHGMGARQEAFLKPYVEQLSGSVLPGIGHYPAEEAPDAMSAALLKFLTISASGTAAEQETI